MFSWHGLSNELGVLEIAKFCPERMFHGHSTRLPIEGDHQRTAVDDRCERCCCVWSKAFKAFSWMSWDALAIEYAKPASDLAGAVDAVMKKMDGDHDRGGGWAKCDEHQEG